MIANQFGLFERFVNNLALDFKFVLVTRHPREMIASAMKRRGHHAEEALGNYWRATKIVSSALENLGERFEVHQLAHEDFIVNPTLQTEKLFRYLELEIDQEHLHAIDGATYKKSELPSLTFPELTPYAKNIDKMIDQYPFLQRYGRGGGICE